jgi:molybdenum cofactor cytidylyltransferase
MASEASSIGAILLAAGASTRLGTPKQLVEIEGEPLVVRQARLLLGIGSASVVVVSGANSEAVEAALAKLPVKLVHNPDWRLGMGRSLACGIGAMPERARAALVILCDQWRLDTVDLNRLVKAWAPNPLAAVSASYEGIQGVPAILPRAMFERLARLEGDSGARRILRRWKGQVVEIPLENASPDLDRPEDLPP